MSDDSPATAYEKKVPAMLHFQGSHDTSGAEKCYGRYTLSKALYELVPVGMTNQASSLSIPSQNSISPVRLQDPF